MCKTKLLVGGAIIITIVAVSVIAKKKLDRVCKQYEEEYGDDSDTFDTNSYTDCVEDEDSVKTDNTGIADSEL